MKEKGQIKDFQLQPEFELQPKFKKRDINFRPIKYIADFHVWVTDDEEYVIDIKGFETADFKIKRKMFEYKYPFELKLLTYSKIDGGWIELDALKKARKERKKQRENKEK